MSRRHADLIEVQTCAAPAGAEPAEFAWRGRRYLVRAVLARWTESGTWWRSASLRTLAGEAGGRVDDRPQQWWRVEADSGRRAELSGGPGVYDLCFEESPGRWSLRRVMD
jgi:hypothetical protein